MAVFSSLDDAGIAFAELIANATGLSLSNVRVGPPLESPTASNEDIRVTLMWLNEDPTHKNDRWERGFSGTEEPPPLTLSLYFLVTYYGGAEAQGGYLRPLQLMSDVLREFHSYATHKLPILGRGSGKFDVALVPITPELMEKLFSPHQTKHRPFTFHELGPVQLVSKERVRPARPVVLPGGPKLEGPSIAARPRIDRVVPQGQGLGGLVRLDGDFPAGTNIRVGGVVAPVVATLDAGRSVVVRVPVSPPDPVGVSPGILNVTVDAGAVAGDPAQLQVVEKSEISADAPTVLVHHTSTDLVLTGRTLGAADGVVFWPDVGIYQPSDLKVLPIVAKTPTKVTVARAQLVPLEGKTWRVSVRSNANAYTPFVMLEVRP